MAHTTQPLWDIRLNGTSVGQLEANLSHDEADRLSLVRAPTLITVGELDMCLPPLYSRQLADGIPDAELVVFPGGSHLFGLQDPDAFNAATLEWLGRQVPAASAG